MTRWMANRPIPKAVVTPNGENSPSREVAVKGIGTVPNCPSCGRKGPIDALTLGDGVTWPNMVVICGIVGDIGCGLYWSLTPTRLDDLHELS